MNQKPYVVWEGVFELHYLENRGAAFQKDEFDLTALYFFVRSCQLINFFWIDIFYRYWQIKRHTTVTKEEIIAGINEIYFTDEDWDQ